jgi:hypothetical protein
VLSTLTTIPRQPIIVIFQSDAAHPRRGCQELVQHLCTRMPYTCTPSGMVAVLATILRGKQSSTQIVGAVGKQAGTPPNKQLVPGLEAIRFKK